MDIAVVTLWVVAFVLASFGVGFLGAGLANERAYWSQRDPHGDARADATKLPEVMRRAFALAAGEYRASLRVAAIGAILIYVAVASAIVAVVVSLASR